MNKNILFGLLLVALVSIYPQKSEAATNTIRIYAGSGDGQAGIGDVEAISSWPLARSYTGPVTYNVEDTFSDNAARSDRGVGVYRVYRGSLPFDTSVIPDDAVIQSATLGLYAFSSFGSQNGTRTCITTHTRSDATNIVGSDYYLSSHGSVPVAPITTLTNFQYTTFNLNSTGLNHLDLDGNTAFSVRTHFDCENIDPGSLLQSVRFNSSEAAGMNTDPYLDVTYTTEDEEIVYPRYTQIISPYPSIPETTEWADDVYANGTGQLGSYPCGLTVAQCGCALTSLVMSARNADIKEDILGDDVNPGNMNAYLSDIDGYASGGALRWLAAQAYFGEFTSGGKIASRFSTPVQRPYGNVMSFIDTALANPKNAVLAYKNGHFVWLPEKTVNTYTVRDPWWYNTMTADDSTADKVKDYNNVFEDARVLTIADEPVEFTGTDIEVHLQGTAELLFKKATGQKVGYDNGTVVVGLDKASYGNTEIVSLGGAPLSGKGKHLIVYEAGSTFTLDVVGTGSGTYTLEFFTISATGEVTTFEFSGQTLPGLTTSFNFDLTSGQATEQSITYEQLLQIVNMQLVGATDQEKKFFLKWTEKIFNDLEKKTATQAIQSIQVYKKLLVAKKIQAPTLTAALDLLQLEVQRR